MNYSYRFFGIFRFILACLVMLQHFGANIAPANIMLALQPYEPGSLAVLAFFCLSGFVIIEAVEIAYIKRPFAFLTNRALRIFPHFALAMLLSVLVHWYFFNAGTLYVAHDAPPVGIEAFSIKNVLLNLFSIFPYADHFLNYNFIPIAWAVRIETLFYLVVFAALLAARHFFNGTPRGFHISCLIAAALLTPLFLLSVLHKLPAMFGFLPYFAYGCALYYALEGSKTAKIIATICIAGMILHFVSLPAQHPVLHYQREIISQLAILIITIALMTYLSFYRNNKLIKHDRITGSFTYPLYMEHFVVMVFVGSAFSHDSTICFLLGMVASIAFSVIVSRILDPLVDRWRDYVRGKKLNATQQIPE